MPKPDLDRKMPAARTASKNGKQVASSKTPEASDKARKPQSSEPNGPSFLDVKIARKKPSPATASAATPANGTASLNGTKPAKAKPGLLSSLIGKVDPTGHNLDSMSIPKKKPRLMTALPPLPAAHLAPMPVSHLAPVSNAPPDHGESLGDRQYHCGWGPTTDVWAACAVNRAAKRALYEKT
jgi:hypothetical protein